MYVITAHQRHGRTDRQTDVKRSHDRYIAKACSGKNHVKSTENETKRNKETNKQTNTHFVIFSNFANKREPLLNPWVCLSVSNAFKATLQSDRTELILCHRFSSVLYTHP